MCLSGVTDYNPLTIGTGYKVYYIFEDENEIYFQSLYYNMDEKLFLGQEYVSKNKLNNKTSGYDYEWEQYNSEGFHIFRHLKDAEMYMATRSMLGAGNLRLAIVEVEYSNAVVEGITRLFPPYEYSSPEQAETIIAKNIKLKKVIAKRQP